MQDGSALKEKTVVIMPDSQVKIVTITIGKKDESGREMGRQYQFYGPWTGKDVRVAIAGLFRGYRQFMQTKRKLAEQQERVG